MSAINLSTATRPLAILTLALTTLLAPAALAQDDDGPTPAQITQHCIQNIATITDNTNTDVRAIAARTRNHIQEIDKAGATNQQIHAVATHGKSHANDRAHAGKSRVANLAGTCIDTLQKLDAPRPLIVAVAVAKRIALSRIETVLTRAKASITRAAAIAINN